jgi:hypothetical protein
VNAIARSGDQGISMPPTPPPPFGRTLPAPEEGRVPLHLYTDDLWFPGQPAAHFVELIERFVVKGEAAAFALAVNVSLKAERL